MRSPALTLAWSVWRRYRWGLAARGRLAGAGRPWPAAAAWGVGARDGRERSHHSGGRRGRRGVRAHDRLRLLRLFLGPRRGVARGPGTGFPTRTSTLPVSTATLVARPMLQGTAAVAITWVAWCVAVLRPAGLDAALVWPALLAAALLAWLQALAWQPFPLCFLRIIAAVPVLAAVGVGPIFALDLGTPPAVAAGVLAALWPGGLRRRGLGVARLRAATYRRGPGRRGLWVRPSRRADRGAPFSSRSRRRRGSSGAGEAWASRSWSAWSRSPGCSSS